MTASPPSRLFPLLCYNKLMFTLNDRPRQIAASSDNEPEQQDTNKYTYSVADAVLAFREASMSITDRTIQRYCHSGKLRAIRVNPDSRQPTDTDNYLFLIDPTSIPERVAQLREKQEFVSPTVVVTSPDLTRHDANGHDVSEPVAAEPKAPNVEKSSPDNTEELDQLREKVMSLEIDKRVRDGLLDQMKNDRKELLSQLQTHVETMTNQSRKIGQLETRLELSAPAPKTEVEKQQAPNNPAQPEMSLEGDNDPDLHSQYGV